MEQTGSLALNNGIGGQNAAGRPISSTPGYLPLVAVIYLYSLLIPAMFNLGSVALSGPRLILLVLVVPMAVDLFSGKLGRVYAVDYLFLLFIGWATLAIAINNPNVAVQQAGSTSIEFLGGYLMGRAYVRTPEAFRSVIRVGFIMILVALPFGVLEMKTGVALWPRLFNSLPGFWGWGDVANPPRMGLERAQVFFSHPIHHGLFCSMFFTLVFVGLRDRVSLGMRVFMTLLVVFGTIQGLSAAPLLSIMLQIGLITWAYIFRSNPARWWLLLGLFALMYVAIDLLSNRSPARVLMTYATFSPQTAYYRAVINEWGFLNVWQNPVFGLGLRDWVRPHYMQRGSVDNFWLLMAMRYGIPGFLIVAWGYADAVLRVGLTKTTEGTEINNQRLAWTITLAGLSFVLYTVHVWTSIYSFTFFLVGAGLWIPEWVRRNGSGEGEALAEGSGPTGGALRTGLVYSREGVAPMTSRAPAASDARGPEGGLARSRFSGDTEPASGYTRTKVEAQDRAQPGTAGGLTFTRFGKAEEVRSDDAAGAGSLDGTGTRK